MKPTGRVAKLQWSRFGSPGLGYVDINLTTRHIAVDAWKLKTDGLAPDTVSPVDLIATCFGKYRRVRRLLGVTAANSGEGPLRPRSGGTCLTG